jgi:hypothetical protein
MTSRLFRTAAGTAIGSLLDVVTEVVVHLATWRSSALPNPHAANTAAGIAATPMRPAMVTSGTGIVLNAPGREADRDTAHSDSSYSFRSCRATWST